MLQVCLSFPCPNNTATYEVNQKRIRIKKALTKIRERITITNMTIQNLLQLLNDDGMTDAEIGAHVGLAQATITRLRNGDHKKTDWDTGQMIMALAKSRKLIAKAA
jgi:hypothetical protein